MQLDTAMELPEVYEFRDVTARDWDLDAVAGTLGPGLIGSLLVGVNVAKAISAVHDLPLVGVNHIEGHIYANWLTDVDVEEPLPPEPPFPLLCLVVSGGHTQLVLMHDHGRYTLLGQTVNHWRHSGKDFADLLDAVGLPGARASFAGDTALVEEVIDSVNDGLAPSRCTIALGTNPARYPQGFLLSRKDPRIGVAARQSEYIFSGVVETHEVLVGSRVGGRIREIAVKEGQQVKAGELVCVLEAMKMENSILAHTEGTVEKLHVEAGQSVETGATIAIIR